MMCRSSYLDHLTAANSRQGAGDSGPCVLGYDASTPWFEVRLRFDTNAINDRGMIQLVRQNGILWGQQDLKQPSVSVKARGIKYGIFTTVEL
ncbi:hypothetical protein E2C01_002615 [Portunus trituberculatus]|uniref:Uncharacterized protein n=1 Tax=Portunus trituberculatus TaxID=210409 RepID=A0A5B7CMG9_PORTR|nr:hypothetical protein [Portunus trituberculatus]